MPAVSKTRHCLHNMDSMIWMDINMMINKRLIGTVEESKKYIAGNVACQWVSLAANISMMGAIAHLLQRLYEGSADGKSIGITAKGT